MTDTSSNGTARHAATGAAGARPGGTTVDPSAPLSWPRDEAPPPEPAAPEHRSMSGWEKWVGFAGVMLVLLGFYQAMEGLVAVLNPGYYAVRSGRLAVPVNYTAWGWTHLVLGVVAVLAGIGLFLGNLAARIAAVVIAGISALVNLVFAAAYPGWSVVVIAVDVVVIWAVTMHGGQLKQER